MVDIHGPLQTRGETLCPGGVSVSCLASRTRHECPRHRNCMYEGLTLDVDRHYIGSVTATTHQEKVIITLESNPSRGTVLPAPHGNINVLGPLIHMQLDVLTNHLDHDFQSNSSHVKMDLRKGSRRCLNETFLEKNKTSFNNTNATKMSWPQGCRM